MRIERLILAGLLTLVAVARADDRPAIWVLATGGTIAGAADPRSAGGYDPGRLSVEGLLAAVPGIEKVARLHAEQIASIGSQDISETVWFALAARVNELLARPEVAGIVITHGTDTLEETAFLLEQVVVNDKPVVLVGAMRPATALGADGPANLLQAVTVAASPEARGRGVLVVLDDTIHESRDVTKTNTTAVSTFASPNVGPVGLVHANGVTFLDPGPPAGPRPRFRLPAEPPLPRVEIIYAHGGMTPQLVQAALTGGAKGIVVAGVGEGNMAAPVIEALAAAVKDGVAVVRSTRTGSGFVRRNIEIDDDRLGFVAAEDLNPQKARLLLQLLLANGVRTPPDLQARFARPQGTSFGPPASPGNP